MTGENEQGVGGTLESDAGSDVDRDVKILEQAAEGKDDEVGLVIPKEEKDDDDKASGEGEGEDFSDIEEKLEDDDDKGKEDDEVKEDLDLPNRPTFNAINRKFPEFFKAFPEVKDMLGREVEYSRRFPTIEAADEALDKSTEFDQISDHLADGNMKGILDTVASVSEDALVGVIDKFLPSLMQRDQNMYLRAITPSLAILANQFYKHGVDKNDKNIQNAAAILSEWIFDTEDYATGRRKYPSPEQTERDPERIKLNREREQFLNTKHIALRDSVLVAANTKLDAKINEGLKGLSGLNDFTKNTIKDKIYEEVGRRLQADATHMKLMDGIWGRARRAGYDDPIWKTRLVTAYLARAIALVPSVRAKVVGQALENRKSAVKSGQDRQRQQPIKVTSQRSDGDRQRTQVVTNRLPNDPHKIDRKKTSDLDILEGRITLKGR